MQNKIGYLCKLCTLLYYVGHNLKTLSLIVTFPRRFNVFECNKKVTHFFQHTQSCLLHICKLHFYRPSSLINNREPVIYS